MLAFGWFSVQVPKRSQPPHRVPLAAALPHCNHAARVLGAIGQAEFVELLSLCPNPVACPSEASQYLRMFPLSLS